MFFAVVHVCASSSLNRILLLLPQTPSHNFFLSLLPTFIKKYPSPPIAAVRIAVCYPKAALKRQMCGNNFRYKSISVCFFCVPVSDDLTTSDSRAIHFFLKSCTSPFFPSSFEALYSIRFSGGNDLMIRGGEEEEKQLLSSNLLTFQSSSSFPFFYFSAARSFSRK